MLDRRIVADGSLVVVWVPSALTMAEQLRLVAVELGLALREPRCMACGGALVPTPKEVVRPRIPPRTALWKDEYFVCAGCDRLFWRGTHWERIERTLAAGGGGLRRGLARQPGARAWARALVFLAVLEGGGAPPGEAAAPEARRSRTTSGTGTTRCPGGFYVMKSDGGGLAAVGGVQRRRPARPDADAREAGGLPAGRDPRATA